MKWKTFQSREKLYFVSSFTLSRENGFKCLEILHITDCKSKSVGIYGNKIENTYAKIKENIGLKVKNVLDEVDALYLNRLISLS